MINRDSDSSTHLLIDGAERRRTKQQV